MSKGGRYAGTGGGKKKGNLGVLIALTVVLVLVLAALVAGLMMGGSELTLQTPETETTVPTTAPVQTEADTTPTTEPTTVPTTLPYKESGKDIINILMVGQAAREGEEYHMADTMILATINKTTKTLTLTSFLRDAYLDLPDYRDPEGKLHPCGWNRINVAYHLGYTFGGTYSAMEMTNQCLQETFGIEVDYDVEVDFRAVIDIVNILDGVEVELTEEEAEYLRNDGKVWQQDIKAGNCWMDGDTALAYARMRKATGDGDSDIKRTSRQRTMLTALLNKIKDQGFSKLQELATTILPMISTNMSEDEITTCIWEILPLLPQLTIEQGTCPVETTYWGEIIDLYGSQSSVLKFDAGQNRRLMMAITEADQQ